MFDETQKRLYQRVTAKLNYLCGDRLDLKFAVSVLASSASQPTRGSMRALKRVGRYLLRVPVAWQLSPAGGIGDKALLGFADADWAGDKVTRRSVSGGVIMQNGGFLTGWSKKQRSIALSSWESELFAAISVGTRCLGVNAELADLGRDQPIVLASDNQSVIDHSRRRGHASASKHVGLRGLWLQEALARKTLSMRKVHTTLNPADVCTKALS